MLYPRLPLFHVVSLELVIHTHSCLQHQATLLGGLGVAGIVWERVCAADDTALHRGTIPGGTSEAVVLVNVFLNDCQVLQGNFP